MAEGVKSAAGTIAESEPSSSPNRPPEPDPDPELAPRGWRYDTGSRQWVARLSPGRKKKNRSAPDTTGDGTEGGQSPGQERDPDPAWMRNGDPEPLPPGKLKFGDVPEQVKDDIAGMAGLIGIPILSLLQQVDPYCGSALMQNYEPVVDAALPLLCRSRKIVDYFTGDKSDWLLWGKLALALKPVGQAVLEHHVFRTVEVVRDDNGIPRIQPRSRGGQDGDHLTPPVTPEFNYAA
jgi:hypothetical protein